MKRRFRAEDAFAIAGMLFILALAYVAIRNSMDPAKAVRYQADVCSEGCRGTTAFDACFQACMWHDH